MPVYTYTSDDGETIDMIFSISSRPDTVTQNGIVYTRNAVYSIARNTEMHRYGVNGFYDADLQASYSSYKERDAILKKKDLTVVTKSEIRDSVQRTKNRTDDATKRIAAHEKAVEIQKSGKASYRKALNAELSK